MLAFFRRRKGLWIIPIIVFSVALIVTLIPMGDTGFHFHGVFGGNVARVGSESISAEEFQSQYDNYMHQVPDLTPEMISAFGIDMQILDQLISQYVIIAEARRLGLDASTADINEWVQTSPDFQEGGVFIGRERYLTVLANSGISASEYEATVRNQVLFDKLLSVLTAATSVSDSEVEAEFRYQNEAVILDYTIIDGATMEDRVTLTEAERREYYEKNLARYNIPERRNARYILVDREAIQAAMEISEADALAYYEEHLPEYVIPATVTAQHILFRTQDKTSEEIAAIRETATEALERANAGEDFGALATEYSDDPSSIRGGELPAFEPGEMVPEFEQAAFSLPVGGTSGLVETEFGMHIIRVNDKREETTRPFEEMRPSIEDLLKFEQAIDLVSERAQSIAVELVGNDDLDAVAERYEASVHETGLIAIGDGIEGLTETTALENRIFSMEVDEPGTAMVVNDSTSYVIPVVTEIQEAHAASYEEALEDVEADLRREKAQELAQEMLAEVQALREDGLTVYEIASVLDLVVQTSDPLPRDGNIPEFGATSPLDEQIFTLDVGATGDPVTVLDRTMIFALRARNEIDQEAMASLFEDLRTQLLDQKKAQLFDAYIREARNRMSLNEEITYDQGLIQDIVDNFAHVH